MAKYFITDWSSLTGWTSRYNTTSSWTAATDLVTPSGAANDWKMLSWDAIDGDANRAKADVLFQVRASNLGSVRHYLMGVRASGADESATLYALAAGLGSVRVYKCTGSDTPTEIAALTTAATTSDDTDYWCRFRINGSTISYKWWGGAVTDEPGGVETDAGWTDSATDTDISAAGWIGPTRYSNDAGTITYKQLSVGTNGDFAPSVAYKLYWIADSGSIGTPTGAEIVAGQKAGGASAAFSGSEGNVVAGSGTITEASPFTGSYSTTYNLAMVLFDGTTYSNVVTGTAQTEPAVARTESAASVEVLVSSKTLTVARTEGTAAVDILSGSTDAESNGTATESAAAVELISAAAELAAQLIEAAGSEELLTAAATLNAALIDAAAGDETNSTATLLNASSTEAAGSVEVLAAVAEMLAQLVESAAGVEQISAAQDMAALLIEPAAGSDVAAAPATFSASSVELVAALDVLAAAIGGPAVFTADGRLRIGPVSSYSATGRIGSESATPAARRIGPTRH